jgi:hypothetical protein
LTYDLRGTELGGGACDCRDFSVEVLSRAKVNEFDDRVLLHSGDEQIFRLKRENVMCITQAEGKQRDL